MYRLEISSTCRRSILIATLLLGLLGGLPATASAQSEGSAAERLENLPEEQKEKFIELVQQGRSTYSDGDFEDAIPYFERAYEIVAKPELHYRIALCYARSGQPAQAIDHYKKFLELKPDTDKRGAVEATIGQLEQQVEDASVARLVIKSDPSDAEVTVGTASSDETEGDTRGRTPLEIEVQPGEVAITLQKEGYQSTEEVVEVEAGETYNFSYTLDERATDAVSGTDTDSAADPTASASSGPSLPVAALVVGGVGALIGGSFYGVGLHCNKNRGQCSRGLYNAAAVGAYSGGAIALGGLGLATFQLLTRSGDSTRAATDDRGIDLEVRVTASGLQLSGTF